MARKRLLIIGAGVEQVKAYKIAREMGLTVVGSDMNPEAPAFEYADERIMASTRDPEETVRRAMDFSREKSIHGVMTIANDVPLTVASVAWALNLPGISVEAATVASDKMLMKECFSKNGVRVPGYREVCSVEELPGLAGEWGYPFILKPVDGRGARGVLRITPEVDLSWAWDEAKANSETGRVMAERFVPGVQISTESVLWRGRCYTPAFSERNYEYLERYSPFIIENGGTMPAPLTDCDKDAVNDLVERAALAMGITDGTVKGDIVMGPEGPVVIELAARLSGGYYATDQIPLSTGVDLVTQAVKLALGEELNPGDLEPGFERGAAIRFFFPEEGEVEAIEGADGLSDMPGVVLSAVYRKPGDAQPPVRSHPDRGGFVLAGGADREEAVQRAEAAIKSVKFRIKKTKVA